MTLPGWLREPAHRFSKLVAADRVPHALIIHGPKGWGQDVLASYLALSLLHDDAESDARLVAHPDLRWFEPESAVLKVDQVREACLFMSQKARFGLAKIAVFNQAECMNLSAGNALLKTLEEPGERSYIFLVTHSPQRLPATVRSRCQRIQSCESDVGSVGTWRESQGYGSDATGQLLAEHGGAPYLTLSALKREDQPIWTTLDDVHDEAMSALEVAFKWRNQNLVDLIERWLRYVHIVARESSDAGPLLRFAEMLSEILMASSKNSGLARQVQLERLLLEWRSLPISGR